MTWKVLTYIIILVGIYGYQESPHFPDPLGAVLKKVIICCWRAKGVENYLSQKSVVLF